MKEITKIMYKKYALNRLKYDFMGFRFNNPQDISFHHLIFAHRYCRQLGLGEGYFEKNGALLVQHTSHDYLHVVERNDYDRFEAITSEMIDENLQGHLDMQNIRAIDDILQGFEREYSGCSTNKGKPLIKPEYVYTRILQKRD